MSDHDKSSLTLPAAIAAIAIVAYLFTSTRVDENLQTIGCVTLFAMLGMGSRLLLSPIAWTVVAVALWLSLLKRPFDVPNHHYMLTYFSAAIAISLTADWHRQAEILRANVRWMMVILMGFATVQKLLQPTFMDGSYLGFELARGSFAAPILKYGNRFATSVDANMVAIEQFRSMPGVAPIKLEVPFDFLPQIAAGFVIAILAIEALLFFGMLYFPTKLVTHLTIISFAITLAVLRQEVTFISVLCTMGLAACRPGQKLLQYSYATLAIVLAAAVLKTINN